MSANDVPDEPAADDLPPEFAAGSGDERPEAPRDEPTGQIALLGVAAGFLTRLPIPGTPDRDPPAGSLARAMRLFPLAGAGIGVLAGLVLLVAGWLALPVAVAAVAALATLVWMTGALHEDGLADVADGFGGGATRDDKLAIMRDSRIGSYGVLALVIAFALKATALAAIAGEGLWLAAAALVAASAWSRAMFAPLMRWLPPAREDGVAAGAGMPDAAEAWQGLALGAALALLVTISGAGGGAIVALLAGGLAAFILGWLALDQAGGYTGDVLGAGQQACETVTLAALAAAMLAS